MSPALDFTYKMVQIMDKHGQVKYKCKTSPGKKTVPGKKQVFRVVNKEGYIQEDWIGLFTEELPITNRPLLQPVIRKGRLIKALPLLTEVRDYAKQSLSQLSPTHLRNFDGNKEDRDKVKFTPMLQKIINTLKHDP